MWKVLLSLLTPVVEQRFKAFFMNCRKFLKWREHKKANKDFTELFWQVYFNILRNQKRNSMICQMVWRTLIAIGLIGWMLYGAFIGHYGWILLLGMFIVFVIDAKYLPSNLWSSREVFWEADRRVSDLLYSEGVARLRAAGLIHLGGYADSLKDGVNNDKIIEALGRVEKTLKAAALQSEVDETVRLGKKVIAAAAATSARIL